jgi:hypothetical protein
MPNVTEVAQTSVTTAPRPLRARSIAAALLLGAQLVLSLLLCLAHWHELTLGKPEGPPFPPVVPTPCPCGPSESSLAGATCSKAVTVRT